jgi:hypothetical protein
MSPLGRGDLALFHAVGELPAAVVIRTL